VTGNPLKAFWSRLSTRRRAEEDERAIEERNMSPEERKFIHENVVDHEADAESAAHLGGINPNRLLDD
jgi:predicted RNA-binding protein Jag